MTHKPVIGIPQLNQQDLISVDAESEYNFGIILVKLLYKIGPKRLLQITHSSITYGSYLESRQEWYINNN